MSLLTKLTLLLGAFGAFADGPDKQSLKEIEDARARIEHDFENVVEPSDISSFERLMRLQKYLYIDVQNEVPADLKNEALLYFDLNRDSFPNQGFITVVDFKPRSDAYRFYLINMADGTVEKYHTTHGVGSDKDNYAKYFSNVPDSHKSSLGYVRTAEVYSGEYGRSVRLDGLSRTNSKIRERAIVLHGWVNAIEDNVLQGLSHGCITLDNRIKDSVVTKVKEGSLLYVGVAED